MRFIDKVNKRSSFINKVSSEVVGTPYSNKIEAKINFLQGAKTLIKKVAKGFTKILLGVGLFSSLASGMTISDANLKEMAKEMTSYAQQEQLNLNVEAGVKKYGDDGFQVKIKYNSEGGSYTLIYTDTGGTLKDMKMKKQGEPDPLAEDLAQEAYKMYRDAMLKEGIRLQN